MGYFLPIEGHDYVGKSSQILLLEQKLKAHGYETLVVRTPGGSSISEQLRVLANRTVNGETASLDVRTLLMTAARIHTFQHVIKPALDRGVVVLADRWVWSGYIYQVIGEGEDYARWKITNRSTLLEEHLPDLTIVLTLDEEERVRRKLLNDRQQPVVDATEQQGAIVEKRMADAISDADELAYMTKRLFTIHQKPDDTMEMISETIFEHVYGLLLAQKEEIVGSDTPS